MLVLLPYKTEKRYVYALDLNRHISGLLKVKRWNSHIKALIPYSASDKIPVIKNYTVDEKGNFVLTSSRVRVYYRSPAWLRNCILKDLGYMVWAEPRKRKPEEAFSIIKDAVGTLHTYFVISSSKIYAKGFEPPKLLISNIILFKHIVVFIT